MFILSISDSITNAQDSRRPRFIYENNIWRNNALISDGDFLKWMNEIILEKKLKLLSVILEMKISIVSMPKWEYNIQNNFSMQPKRPIFTHLLFLLESGWGLIKLIQLSNDFKMAIREHWVGEKDWKLDIFVLASTHTDFNMLSFTCCFAVVSLRVIM